MLRSCKQHPSVGCCLPFTAYRTSIGNKWTRFSRKNNNTKIHRSNIICPISDACTAVRCYLDGAGLFKITFIREIHFISLFTYRRGEVCSPNVAILSSRWSISDERSLPLGRDDMVRTPPLQKSNLKLYTLN